MSISTTILRCVEEGSLLPWAPGHPGAPSKRCLFLTPEIARELDPDGWEEPSLGQRYGQLAADFDRFTEGLQIPIAMSPYEKAKHAYLARIDPVEYGIWTLRSIDPSPAIRVFGAFIEVDHFVCLRTALRAELDGPNGPKWANAREDAIAIWNKITEDHTRLLGDHIEDYISEKTTAV